MDTGRGRQGEGRREEEEKKEEGGKASNFFDVFNKNVCLATKA